MVAEKQRPLEHRSAWVHGYIFTASLWWSEFRCSFQPCSTHSTLNGLTCIFGNFWIQFYLMLLSHTPYIQGSKIHGCVSFSSVHFLYFSTRLMRREELTATPTFISIHRGSRCTDCAWISIFSRRAQHVQLYFMISEFWREPRFYKTEWLLMFANGLVSIHLRFRTLSWSIVLEIAWSDAECDPTRASKKACMDDLGRVFIHSF